MVVAAVINDEATFAGCSETFVVVPRALIENRLDTNLASLLPVNTLGKSERSTLLIVRLY